MALLVDAAPAQRSAFAPHVAKAEQGLVFWHLTSLDAPTVAVVWSLAFAWSAGLHLKPWTPILLALVTWCIYVGDRLLDARRELKIHSTTLRERHLFHWCHRKLFLPLAGVAACAAITIVVTCLPALVRDHGSMMVIAALTYLSGVHLGRGSDSAPASAIVFPNKELCVGVLFTAGCALPSWPRLHNLSTTHPDLWPFWIPVVCFATLAWLNCAFISRWEAASTSSNSLQSGSGRDADAGRLALFRLAILFAAAFSLLAAMVFAEYPRTAALLASGSASGFLLALLDRIRHRMGPTTLRAAADLVLLTPLVLLWQ